MPGATLDAIDAALFAALQTLSAANGGPFTTVQRWAGELPRPDAVTRETFGRAPAVLLALDGEVDDSDLEPLTGDAEVRGRSTWLALVVVEDPRGTQRTVKGSQGIPGALALAQQVQAALNGLRVGGDAAILSASVTGTSGATAHVGGGRLEDANGTPWLPAVPTVSLDGSGLGTINIRCGVGGSVGNLINGDVLTWTLLPPDISGSATVAATVAAGTDGLLRNSRVRCKGTRWLGVIPGVIAVLAVRFEAIRVLPEAALADASVALSQIRGDVNLLGTTDAAPNPVDQFQQVF